MKTIGTDLAGVSLVQLEPNEDERGSFTRTWCRREFGQAGLAAEVAQCSLALTRRRGTLRGMHLQVAPFAEAKLVHCLAGAIYDVVLDLRPGSPTWGQWRAFEIAAGDRRVVHVPEHCAHGYLTLADDTLVHYMMTAPHEPEAERIVRWNDPKFGIRWPVAEPILSERDAWQPDYDGTLLRG